MSCSRTQHGGGRSRTPDLSLRSPTLYHWATALPGEIWRIIPKLSQKLSCLRTKPTKWSVRPAKTQISLDICPVWSGSSLCAQWVAKDPSFLHADSKDSDQTGQMPRLIRVFAGHTCHFVGLSCCGSISPSSVSVNLQLNSTGTFL